MRLVVPPFPTKLRVSLLRWRSRGDLLLSVDGLIFVWRSRRLDSLQMVLSFFAFLSDACLLLLSYLHSSAS